MHNEIEQEFLRSILETTVAPGGSQYADIYIGSSTATQIKLDDRKIEVLNSGTDAGIGFRLTDFDKTAYSYSNEITEKKLKNLASEAKQIIRADKASTLELNTEAAPSKIMDHATDVAIDTKIKLLEKCESAARSVGNEIKQVTVSYMDTRKSVRIINSDGFDIRQEFDFVRLIVQVIAAREGLVQVAFEAPGLQTGFDFFDIYDVERLGKEVAERAVIMLDSKPAPSGPMPVVLAAGSGGVIFHEATGHGLEADSVDKHSVYKNKLGQKIASDVVNLVDNAVKGKLWGSYDFDDEGTPGQETVLIENGILKNYLCDKVDGKKIGMASTGNGRRENYMHPPIPRMSNTYLLPGNASKEDIISKTEKGLFAKKLGGGQVDPQSGDYVFSVAEGYLIENGKLTSPVRGATLVGNGPETLFKIDMVADDPDYDPGTCGKDGQAAPVTTGQPTIRISNLIVGGTQIS